MTDEPRPSGAADQAAPHHCRRRTGGSQRPGHDQPGRRRRRSTSPRVPLGRRDQAHHRAGTHGAWADASSWDKVILQLQDDGFTAYAPPNPLRSLPQDSAYLHDFLTQNAALAGRPVVLVGHSYGGAVITNAAVGDPQVKALVYVDALIPEQGETLLQLVSAQPGSCLGGNPASVFSFVPYPGGPPGDVDTYIKPNLVPGCFATGLPPSQAAVIAATQRPLAASTLQEPSGTSAWKTIPSWAVIGTADQVIPPAELTFMAQRAGAHITDVTAGHLSMISDPETVAQVIEQAAQATS